MGDEVQAKEYVQEEIFILIPIFEGICLCGTSAGDLVARSGRDALSTHQSAQRGQEVNEMNARREAHQWPTE